LFRKTLSTPFKGYAVICAIAAIACPATLVLAGASYVTAKVIEGED